MPTFSQTIAVAASPPRLWSLVSDVQRVALLFPFACVEDVQTPERDCWLFWRQLSIPNVANLRWREQARVVEDREMRFHAVEGDLAVFNGHWRVAPDGQSATLTLTVEYEIPAGVGPQMPAVVVGYVMGEIFKSICQRLKEAAEEEG